MAFNGKRGKHVGGNGGRGGASGRGGSHGWEAPQDYHVGEGSDPGNDTGLTLLHQEFTTSAGGIEVMRATTQDHRRWEQPYSFRTFLTAAATLFKRDMFSLSGIVAYRINEETPIPPVLITLGRSLDFEPNFQQHRALADLVTTCDEGDIIYVNSDCTWNQNACAVPDCPVNLTGWSVEQRLAHTDTHSNDTTAIEGASAGHKLQAYEKRVQGLREEVALLRQQNERLRREKDDAVAKHVTSEARLQGEKLTVQQPTKSDGTRTKQLSNQLANELQRIAIFEQREIKLKDENDALKEAVAKNDLQPLQDQLSAEQEKNADLQKEIDNLLEQIQDAQPPPVDESVLQSLRDQSSTAQNDNDGLRKEIESLRQQINDVQSTPVDEAGLQAQLIETQNQLKDSEGTLRTIINRLGAAEIDLDKTRSKLLSAGTNVDDMANDINELQSSNQTLQTALEDCRAIHEDLKAQLTAKPAKGVIPKLRKEIALLQKDLDNCRASHKELEASNQKLEASNIKLIKKTPQKPGNGSPAGSQKEVADLRNTIKDLHKELALCIARHDTMKDTNTELMKQIAAKPATGSPTKLQKELAALRIKHESLQEEMTNAMDRNETLEKQLAAQSGDGQGQTAHPIHPDDPNRRQPLRPAEAKAYSNRYCNWCGERVDRLVSSRLIQHCLHDSI